MKLFGKSTLGIPNFHGRRGQAKTFAQKYCPGGGNIYSLSLAYFSKFPLRHGLRGWGDYIDWYITICHYCFSFLPLSD